MFRRIRYLGTFLPHRMHREIQELYLSTGLINLGVAMVQIFEPIYLYSIGYSLQWIMIFYLIVYGAYLFLMPLGAKFAGHHGNESSIVISTIFIVALYLSLYGIAWYPGLFYVAALFYSLQKTFYWPAFHADFAKNERSVESGREISGLMVVTTVLFTIGPILAGLIITFLGFGWLFIFVSIIFLLSNLPLLSTKEKVIRRDFSYGDFFRQLFEPANRRSLWAYVGYAEEFVGMVMWPIFIIIALKNDLTTGLVVGLSVFISVIVTLIAGKFTDYHDGRSLLRAGSLTYALSWFFRLFNPTTWGIVLLNSWSWISKNVISITLTDITYSKARHSDVMYKIVNFESSLVIGKLSMIIFIYAVAAVGAGEHWVFALSFIVAGLTSLLYMLI